MMHVLKVLTRLVFALSLLTVSFGTLYAQGDSPSDGFPVITAERAHLLERIATLGRGEINDFVYTPNGEDLIVASGQGIWIYDADDLHREPEFVNVGLVKDIAISPDGVSLAMVLVGPPQSGIQILDLATLEMRLSQPDGMPNIAFSSDGSVLAFGVWGGRENGNIGLLNLKTGKRTDIELGYPVRYRLLDTIPFAFKDDRLYFGEGDSQGFYVRNISGQNEVIQLSPYPRVQDVVTQSGNNLLAVNDSGNVTIWNTNDNIQHTSFYTLGEARVTGLAINGSLLACIRQSLYDTGQGFRPVPGSEKVIDLWNIETQTKLAEIPAPRATQIIFAPDNSTLAITTSYAIYLWNPNSFSELDRLEGPHYSIGNNGLIFNPIQSSRFAHYAGHLVFIEDVATSEQVLLSGSTTAFVYDLAFSPDGTTLAASYSDGNVYLWNLATYEQIAMFSGRDVGMVKVAFGAQGNLLASGDYDGRVYLWDIQTGEAVRVFELEATLINGDMRFNSDGTLLVACGGDLRDGGRLRVWNVTTGARVTSLVADADVAEFSSMGTTLAYIQREWVIAGQQTKETLRVIDTLTGQPQVALEAYNLVRDMDFNSGNSVLAVANSMNVDDTSKYGLGLWNIGSNSIDSYLQGTSVESVSFGADDSLLAIGYGSGNTFDLMDVRTGSIVATYDTSWWYYEGPQFNIDGTLLVTWDDRSGQIEIWGIVDDGKDNDGDGVTNVFDRCPDANGSVATEGCPDTDSDGVPDQTDLCPEEPGTLLTQGCPDADGDSIADRNDQCPNEAGSQLANGCPDADSDGLVDSIDACPSEWGITEKNGCPPIGTVNANTNLREGPGTTYAIVITIPPGSEFALLGRNETGDWLRVRTIPTDGTDAIEAWAFTELITTDWVSIDGLPVIAE